MNSGPCDYELECIDLRARVAEVERERDEARAAIDYAMSERAATQAGLDAAVASLEEFGHRVAELEWSARVMRDCLNGGLHLSDEEQVRIRRALAPSGARRACEGGAVTTREELVARITEYLTAGGLFNPEHMEHDKVRDLLMDCRTALAQPAEPTGREATYCGRQIVWSNGVGGGMSICVKPSGHDGPCDRIPDEYQPPREESRERCARCLGVGTVGSYEMTGVWVERPCPACGGTGSRERCAHHNRWTTKDDILECMDCHAVLESEKRCDPACVHCAAWRYGRVK